MRNRSTSTVLALAVLLGACAAMQRETTVESSVVLGPGGRAEGRVAVPAGAECEVELENKGPGRADYVVRILDGEKLASGTLHEASAGVKPAGPVTMVVVIEAYDDAGTTVEYELESKGSIDLTWDLSRAFRKVEAK